MERRRLLLGMGAALAAGPLVWASEPRSDLRIGLTPVFLDDQAAFLNRWRSYLQDRSGIPIQFVQRSSYREIVEQVLAGDLDLAWMCGFPYVTEQRRLRLMATPLFRGRPEYHSYLIAHRDEKIERMEDLAAKVYAFSDPNSFSGCVYPRHLLQQAGLNGETHFRRSFFTWSHRKVVDAVAVGLADAGSVAGYVWETLALLFPGVTSLTRVVHRSPGYGFPPFVARTDLDPEIFHRLQQIFLDMRKDALGAGLLAELNLDGFIPATPAMYDSIATIAKSFQAPDTHVS